MMNSTEKRLKARLEDLDGSRDEGWALGDRERWALAAHARELAEQGEARRARIILRALIELDPGCAHFHVFLGTLDLDDGELETAERALLRAVELDPEAPAARLRLAETYLAGRRLDEAASALRRAAEFGENDRFANRARVLLDRMVQSPKVAARAGGQF